MSRRSVFHHAAPLVAAALIRTPGNVVALVRRTLDARRARARLARDLACLEGMDDRQLGDLGLGRGDVARLAAGLGSRDAI